MHVSCMHSMHMYALCKVRVTIRITAPQPHRSRRHTTRIRHVEWSAVDVQGRRIFKDKQGSFLFFYLLNGKGNFLLAQWRRVFVPCEGKKYLRLHFPDSAIFYRLKVRVGKVG